MSADEWGTETTTKTGLALEDRIRPTLLARAGKRQVARKGEGQWIVMGDGKLGDSYSFYTVTQQGNLHHCTCQDHHGGQYRKTCSHILAVILWKRDHPGWNTDQYLSPSETLRETGGYRDIPEGSNAAPGGTEAAPSSELEAISPPSVDPTTEQMLSQLVLPPWVDELRPHQIDAIKDVVEAFERGARVVFLDAPTGSGKTLIAECVRQLVNGVGKTIYTCSTKGLQDQFVKDFVYAKVIKGKDNYKTEFGEWPDITCGDCTMQMLDDDCNWCSGVGRCGYRVAKAEALGAELCVANTSYVLTSWNGPQSFQGRPLVIVDECDLLESSLMGHAEVRISEKRVEELGIGYPKFKTKKESWAEWAYEARPRVLGAINNLPSNSDNVHLMRKRRGLEQLAEDLKRLYGELLDEDSKWVYMEDHGTIIFKPVVVDRLGPEYLWQHGEKWLLMSASIISPQEMAESLGLDDDWELVSVPSTFPVENRRVRVVGVGNMAKKEIDKSLPKMLESIRKVVEYHKGERVLVHAVSYKLANEIVMYLNDHLSDRVVVSYREGRERERALQRYMDTEGAVMVAPSMDRGVDLPGDLCRVQIVAKVPFPNLGDKQVNDRLYGTKGGNLWFAVQTARTLVQMTGRGVRSAEDWAVTYILDSGFARYWKMWERLFPGWWKEAVDWSGKARGELGL